MKLMRNDPKRDGICKYALIRLDKLDEKQMRTLRAQADDLERTEVLADMLTRCPDLIEFGMRGTEDEFFVIKLKDMNARAALNGYAAKAIETDSELSQDVAELAKRAGSDSPWCKMPD